MNNDAEAPRGYAPYAVPGTDVNRLRPQAASLPENLTSAHQQILELSEALTAAQQRERTLAHELQNRVRNILAVIRSVHRRTWESGASQEEMVEHFDGRLAAMARRFSHIDHVRSLGVDLEDMLFDELLTVHFQDSENCTISGPSVRLPSEAAEWIGLAFHELTTNSIKFGALAQDKALTIRWTLEKDAGGPVLDFHWVESGITLVGSAPRPVGFGRQLIEEVLPYQLGASTSFGLSPGKLDCSIRLPLRQQSSVPAAVAESEISDVPFDGQLDGQAVEQP